ncbi:MAG: hypothetical protein Q9170_007061 [Blastenia crenularia]
MPPYSSKAQPATGASKEMSFGRSIFDYGEKVVLKTAQEGFQRRGCKFPEYFTDARSQNEKRVCSLEIGSHRRRHTAVSLYRMYLPRGLISQLYQHLLRTHHAQSPPILILVSLEPDALCACRILAALLKRDYVPHKIHPVSGYSDLTTAGEQLVQPMTTQLGGSGGVVVCLGVGGMVDVATVLGLDNVSGNEDPSGGVQVWLIDARRPWNLGNVFAGRPEDALEDIDGNARIRAPDVVEGRIQSSFKPGQGGIVVYDDGDIEEELATEREAYITLLGMPDVEDGGEILDDSDGVSEIAESIDGERPSKKRKSWSDRGDGGDESEEENRRPRQRRRSDSSDTLTSSPSRLPRPRRQQPLSSNASRSPSQSPPSSPPPVGQATSPRKLRRRLLRLRRKYEAVLHKYYSRGATYSEPISSLLYSLAEDLGREDNDLLWNAIVGVSSLELYGRSMTGVGISGSLEFGGSAGWGGQRGERIRQVLRDEVRRLNPPDPADTRGENARGETSGVIPTTARSPTDTSIRLSPEPRFLLIRHWSLYDSMLHSPYLAARLHIWSDVGRKRLHKLLAKMGVSLSQCKQNYTHMDMELKRGLRQSLLTYAPMYGLDGLVPPPASAGRGKEGWGFVRSWGWKACLSAIDVGVIVGAILEVGRSGIQMDATGKTYDQHAVKRDLIDEDGSLETQAWVERFWEAYDALGNIEALKQALPTAQHLHRAILRTGTSLIEKRQIRHLKAFRMAVVKEGPDVQLFTHPAALTKLALWVGEAIAEQEKDQRGKVGKHGKGTPLVMAGLNEARGVYVIVGTGGGGGVVDIAMQEKRKQRAEAKSRKELQKIEEKEKRIKERKEKQERKDDDEEEEETEEEDEDDSDESDDDDIDEHGYGRNRFGNAFQEVVDETNARVRIDSFESCVVEIKKEDLSGFLESLSMKAVIGEKEKNMMSFLVDATSFMKSNLPDFYIQGEKVPKLEIPHLCNVLYTNFVISIKQRINTAKTALLYRRSSPPAQYQDDLSSNDPWAPTSSINNPGAPTPSTKNIWGPISSANNPWAPTSLTANPSASMPLPPSQTAASTSHANYSMQLHQSAMQLYETERKANVKLMKEIKKVKEENNEMMGVIDYVHLEMVKALSEIAAKGKGLEKKEGDGDGECYGKEKALGR